MSVTASSTLKAIVKYLYQKTGNIYGACGLAGNLWAESGCKANNLQNSYNTKLGMTDAEYTAAVDDGSYTAFATDSAGYGLAQWTYKTRKAALLEYHQGKGKSIGDRATQQAFLVKELKESYSSVWKTLQSAESVKEASDAVLTKFEKPADQSDSAKTKRAGYGQEIYDLYAETLTKTNETSSTTATEVTASKAAASKSSALSKTYTTTANLNLRDGAGTKYKSLVVLPKGTSVRCYGYYTSVSGTKWLYVQVTYQNVKYTGFCCSTYLK